MASALGMKTKANSPREWVKPADPDSTGNTTLQPLTFAKGEVPNVAGLGLRDALYLLEQAGLRVIAVGKGRVSKQSIAPGSQYAKGTQIIIHLS